MRSAGRMRALQARSPGVTWLVIPVARGCCFGARTSKLLGGAAVELPVELGLPPVELGERWLCSLRKEHHLFAARGAAVRPLPLRLARTALSRADPRSTGASTIRRAVKGKGRVDSRASQSTARGEQGRTAAAAAASPLPAFATAGWSAFAGAGRRWAWPGCFSSEATTRRERDVLCMLAVEKMFWVGAAVSCARSFFFLSQVDVCGPKSPAEFSVCFRASLPKRNGRTRGPGRPQPGRRSGPTREPCSLSRSGRPRRPLAGLCSPARRGPERAPRR